MIAVKTLRDGGQSADETAESIGGAIRMHAKVTIADDVVFTGSFNLSRSGEQNAEDVLEIHEVRALYPRFTP